MFHDLLSSTPPSRPTTKPPNHARVHTLARPDARTPPSSHPQVRETSRFSLFGRGLSAPKAKTNEAVKKDFSDIILPEGLHNQVRAAAPPAARSRPPAAAPPQPPPGRRVLGAAEHGACVATRRCVRRAPQGRYSRCARPLEASPGACQRAGGPPGPLAGGDGGQHQAPRRAVPPHALLRCGAPRLALCAAMLWYRRRAYGALAKPSGASGSALRAAARCACGPGCEAPRPGGPAHPASSHQQGRRARARRWWRSAWPRQAGEARVEPSPTLALIKS